MAATGTEYVTLEQLKDLVTNMIQPLVDAVGAWDKSEHGNVSMAEFCENLTGACNINLPIKINSSGSSVDMSTSTLFVVNGNGTYSQGQGLGNLIANLMLAAPNGDNTQLFGYLGDNTATLTTTPAVRSSAALTYAAESGGSTDVPVGTLSVQGEYGQVFKKTEGGTEPVATLSLCEDQVTGPNLTNPLFTVSAAVPGLDAGFMVPNEGNMDGSPDMYSIIAVNLNADQRLTSSDLPITKTYPDISGAASVLMAPEK